MKNQCQNDNGTPHQLHKQTLTTCSFYMEIQIATDNIKINLKDFLNWKVFDKVIPKSEFIIKENNLEKNSFEQSCSVIISICKYHQKIKKENKKLNQIYNFGDMISDEKGNGLKIQENGKLVIIIKRYLEKNSQQAEALTKLQFKIAQIQWQDEQQKIKLFSDLLYKQTSQKYQQQINNIQAQNIQMLREIQKIKQRQIEMAEFQKKMIAFLKSPNAHKIKIYLKTLNDQKFQLKIHRCAQIQQLKTMIYHITNIPQDQQRIIWAGYQLQNNRKLSDYSLQNQTTLNIVKRIKN